LHSGSGPVIRRYAVWAKRTGVMIELVMYFGIGYLVAALLGLLFIPLVHNRAVRLTMKQLEASTPLSTAEVRADKDQLRAESAMATRRLEMKIEMMKAQTTWQLAEGPGRATRDHFPRWRHVTRRCATSCAPPRKNFRSNQTRSAKPTVSSPTRRLS